MATARRAESSRSRSAFPRACSSSMHGGGARKSHGADASALDPLPALGYVQRCALGAIRLDLRDLGTQLREALRRAWATPASWPDTARACRPSISEASAVTSAPASASSGTTSTCQPRWRNTCAVALPTAATAKLTGLFRHSRQHGRHCVTAGEHDPVELARCVRRACSSACGICRTGCSCGPQQNSQAERTQLACSARRSALRRA